MYGEEREGFRNLPALNISYEGEPIKEWEYLERTFTKEEWAIISVTAEKVDIKHENDIRDEYMMELIEGGIL